MPSLRFSSGPPAGFCQFVQIPDRTLAAAAALQARSANKKHLEQHRRTRGRQESALKFQLGPLLPAARWKAF